VYAEAEGQAGAARVFDGNTPGASAQPAAAAARVSSAFRVNASITLRVVA
jgi:hypothetical protein